MHNISLNTLFIGKSFIFLPMCHSTNEYAEKLILENNFFEGTTIVTSNQTRGKGQRGSVWESEPGKNLTFSIILKPVFLALNNQFYLNIISSLAILKILAKYSQGFKVKWPNDIYWYDYKIGGILIENKLKASSIETSVMGMGINVNQEDFGAYKASSLNNILHQELSLENLLGDILHSIEFYYLKLKSGKFQELYNEYLDNLYWINEVHTFRKDSFFKGEIIGIDQHGRLEIKVENEIKNFDLKEIQFIE